MPAVGAGTKVVDVAPFGKELKKSACPNTAFARGEADTVAAGHLSNESNTRTRLSAELSETNRLPAASKPIPTGNANALVVVEAVAVVGAG